MLAGIVLQSSSQESLWEEEARNPETFRRTEVNPFLKELYSGIQILSPGSQRFHG